MRDKSVPILIWLASLSAGAWGTDLSELYARVDPSVVVLHTYTESPVTERQQEGLGSGVVISADGKILTAAHLVHTADAVHVEFQDGSKYLGRVIGSAPAADLALLQLSRLPEKLSVATLGDSDQVRIGHEVFVVGAPYGLQHTLTSGHISGRHWGDALGKLALEGEFFQTDAAINQGNSGGPLFNLDGEVIGIVSHIETKSGGNEGLGFAVTANTARELMLERKSYWTGLSALSITPMIAKAINYPGPGGLLVQDVAKGSAADEMGLQGGTIPATIGKQQLLLGGDVLVSVDGIAIIDRDSLKRIADRLESQPDDAEFEAEIFRQGRVVRLTRTKP